MNTIKNIFAASVLTLTLVAIATPVRADLLSAPTEIYFNLTGAKDQSQDHKNLWGGFEFVVSKTDAGASLTLKLTPEGVANGYGTGDGGIKFKDFSISLTGLNDIFTTTQYDWSNNGWTGADNQGTSTGLTFKNGMDWETFLTIVDDMVINAHILSINANGNGGYSLNDAKFTYYGTDEPGQIPPTEPGEPGDSAATPEPATLLLFGLGMVGLGIRRRFAK
jgi:hypothetical protein